MVNMIKPTGDKRDKWTAKDRNAVRPQAMALERALAKLIGYGEENVAFVMLMGAKTFVKTRELFFKGLGLDIGQWAGRVPPKGVEGVIGNVFICIDNLPFGVVKVKKKPATSRARFGMIEHVDQGGSPELI